MVHNNKFEKDYPWHEEDKEVDRIYVKGQKVIDKSIKQWENDIRLLKEKQDKLVSKDQKFSKEYFKIELIISGIEHKINFIKKSSNERKKLVAEWIKSNNEPLW